MTSPQAPKIDMRRVAEIVEGGGGGNRGRLLGDGRCSWSDRVRPWKTSDAGRNANRHRTTWVVWMTLEQR